MNFVIIPSIQSKEMLYGQEKFLNRLNAALRTIHTPSLVEKRDH